MTTEKSDTPHRVVQKTPCSCVLMHYPKCNACDSDGYLQVIDWQATALSLERKLTESAQAPNSEGTERDVLKTQNDSMREYLRTIQDSTYRNTATLRGIAHDALQANPPLLSERNER